MSNRLHNNSPRAKICMFSQAKFRNLYTRIESAEPLMCKCVELLPKCPDLYDLPGAMSMPNECPSILLPHFYSRPSINH
ncbi:hypothetical protein VTL71DRAFT_5658 [Oculimacula yallundae]|uniref:Uncharacterized protein n=1 Tax=Oculimacula yallundae TaxID=86028 RepID=A0ABR4BZB7_9HELO